jgi:hypothetical protein
MKISSSLVLLPLLFLSSQSYARETVVGTANCIRRQADLEQYKRFATQNAIKQCRASVAVVQLSDWTERPVGCGDHWGTWNGSEVEAEFLCLPTGEME